MSSVSRSVRTGRSATLIGALLLSTALAAPAFAQIEEVVVTAQKKTEDAQTVPIAITAFTAGDLKAKQIDQFKDLVFSTPNVSYTKGNFTGSDFQIRGIGITAVGYDAESGVAVHEDDVFLSNPPLAEASFYDLDRIEVLRGPQSTLYGRGATGGTVNVITAKPNLDEFHTDLEASYGNYNYQEVKGMVNIPIIEGQLGLRLAGDWLSRDGFVKNVANGDKLDGRDQYSLRGTLRWQPTARTTIDIIAAGSHEDDNRMRSQKQLCSSDPTGTLGCLPDTLSNGLVNLNAGQSTIASSVQGLNSAFAGTPLAGLGNALGLYDLTAAPTTPALCLQPGNPCNPSDPRKVFSDFDPTYKATDAFYALNWKQNLTDWLDSTLVVGYDRATTFSQESYNNVNGLTFDPTRLAVAEGTFLGLLSALGGPAYAANYAPFFSHPGELPVSKPGNLGLISGDIAKFTPQATAFDQSNGYSRQYSAELRFNSSFQGPVNFMLAGYYLRTKTTGNYFVDTPTLDYPSILLGGIEGLNAPGLCGATGCIFGPGYYNNNGHKDTLTSKAVFGEVYYDAIPDLLKFTAGLRWTEDEKRQSGRIELLDGLIPIGTTNADQALANLVAQGQTDFDGSVPGGQVWQLNNVNYNKLTGRFVVDYTPKLDFTDQTLFYASYARGYKAGGFNPGVAPGLGVPVSYKPESIDAFELGTKNILLNGTLQANGDIWYYDYKSLQVSAIENNTSVNQNINAKLWGVEGELFWAPDTHWQFNLSLGTTQSSIGNSQLVDDRNPTAGRSDVVLIKDATLAPTSGQNCVLYMTAGQTVSPADNAAFQAAAAGLGAGGIFFAPPGGSHALAAHGVANTNYGSCNTALDPLLAAFGYSRTDPTGKGSGSGAFVNLKGNQLQNTPDFTASVGAQYTFDLNGGYTLVPRADYYWQSHMFARIFNDNADRIKAWGVGNAQITLNAPDNLWYASLWVKNVFDSNNVTGEYLASATSGLSTNEFLGDPRTFGITAGIRY
ncbi:MAG TPA: TonB-dependent receptor [Rhizomicrobium sp.]|nr:TonB-dependent receptor [Rhizomicrobium sp.]